MTFDNIPSLLADILAAQQQTNLILADLLAAQGKPAKAKAEKAQAVVATPAPAVVIEPVVEQTASEYAKQKAKTAEPDPVPAPDYDTTATAVKKLAAAKGADAARAVLGTFGAATLKTVEPEKFAAVIAACEEALA